MGEQAIWAEQERNIKKKKKPLVHESPGVRHVWDSTPSAPQAVCRSLAALSTNAVVSRLSRSLTCSWAQALDSKYSILLKLFNCQLVSLAEPDTR